jgi:hypothetical protein
LSGSPCRVPALIIRPVFEVAFDCFSALLGRRRLRLSGTLAPTSSDFLRFPGAEQCSQPRSI